MWPGVAMPQVGDLRPVRTVRLHLPGLCNAAGVKVIWEMGRAHNTHSCEYLGQSLQPVSCGAWLGVTKALLVFQTWPTQRFYQQLLIVNICCFQNSILPYSLD